MPHTPLLSQDARDEALRDARPRLPPGWRLLAVAADRSSFSVIDPSGGVQTIRAGSMATLAHLVRTKAELTAIDRLLRAFDTKGRGHG